MFPSDSLFAPACSISAMVKGLYSQLFCYFESHPNIHSYMTPGDEQDRISFVRDKHCIVVQISRTIKLKSLDDSFEMGDTTEF